MTPEQIIALAVGVLGAGGIGGAIVGALANRHKAEAEAVLIRAEAKKVVAEATSVLQEAYETRIKNLTDRTTFLETRLDVTTAELRELRCSLTDRESVILTLQKENADLKTEVETLRKQVKNRDSRIVELERRVTDLSKRLNLLDEGNECSPQA